MLGVISRAPSRHAEHNHHVLLDAEGAPVERSTPLNGETVVGKKGGRHRPKLRVQRDPRGLASQGERILAELTMKALLEAGVHFGHRTQRWNPKMETYIYMERNGIYLIDLQKSLRMGREAVEFVRQAAGKGGHVLFVGTKQQAREIIQEEAKRSGQFFVTHRWLGGMLTNWTTISKSIGRLRQLEEMEEQNVPGQQDPQHGRFQAEHVEDKAAQRALYLIPRGQPSAGRPSRTLRDSLNVLKIRNGILKDCKRMYEDLLEITFCRGMFLLRLDVFVEASLKKRFIWRRDTPVVARCSAAKARLGPCKGVP